MRTAHEGLYENDEYTDVRLEPASFREKRGEYFDVSNLVPLTPEQKEEFMASRMWERSEDELIEWLKEVSQMEEEEDTTNSHLGDDDVLAFAQEEAASASPEDFWYNRAKFTQREQEQHYLKARELLQPVREKISKLRTYTYTATVAVICSSALLGLRGQNQANDILMKMGFGSGALTIAGVRSRLRSKRKQLMKDALPLEVVVQEFESQNTGRIAQEFYDANNVPVNVLTNNPDPYIHNLLYEKKEPETKIEKWIDTAGDALEAAAGAVHDALF